MQWEGDPAEAVPLLGFHTRGGPLRLATLREKDALVMQGYAWSIAVAGDAVAITSAKGGAVMVFGLDGQQRTVIRRQDASGIAAGAGGFVLTDGLGGISACDGTGLRPLTQARMAWDNHLVAL